MTKRNLLPTRLVLAGALAGLLAAAMALGVAELVAGITGPQGSPVVSLGGTAIDLTPVPVKDFAIAHFGSNDKTGLVSGILVLLGVFAAVIGALAVRRMAYGLAGLAVFGALGVAATATPASHRRAGCGADTGRRRRRGSSADRSGPCGQGRVARCPDGRRCR